MLCKLPVTPFLVLKNVTLSMSNSQKQICIKQLAYAFYYLQHNSIQSSEQ